MIYKKNTVRFSDEQDKIKVTNEIKCLVKASIYTALDFEDFNEAFDVSVTFCDNDGIREMNRNYRHIDSVTDVLSFPILGKDDTGADYNPETGAVLLGDIVISLERAAEQAKEYEHSLTREIAFLTVHSVLHLLGYDHVTSEEEEKDMFARQEAILDVMGITRKGNIGQ